MALLSSRPVPDAGSAASNDILEAFGIPTPPPVPPVAPPTVSSAPAVFNTAPTVSVAPRAGQGVALTASGVLPPSAAATGLRMLAADPSSPLVGEFWYRTDLDKLSIKTATGVKRSAAFV